eukprot:2332107-Amphidinium_carterae.1
MRKWVTSKGDNIIPPDGAEDLNCRKAVVESHSIMHETTPSMDIFQLVLSLVSCHECLPPSLSDLDSWPHARRHRVWPSSGEKAQLHSGQPSLLAVLQSPHGLESQGRPNVAVVHATSTEPL